MAAIFSEVEMTRFHPVSGRRGFDISPGHVFMTGQNPFDKFDASDFVNLALSPIPSKFGRLVCLAGLRDHENDPLADMLYGKGPIDAALQEKHREVFNTWLGLSLEARLADVTEYFANEGGNNTGIAKWAQRWMEEKLYERLRPIGAGESEWSLFSSGLEAILQLLLRLGVSGTTHRG
jgi:hypothetical protein